MNDKTVSKEDLLAIEDDENEIERKDSEKAEDAALA
ncbi:hypothetical protein MPC1_6190001 [Methylocella tundrae]|nr:hypothetical protein MPC1_6190001 [Methylocella tundrae]